LPDWESCFARNYTKIVCLFMVCILFFILHYNTVKQLKSTLQHCRHNSSTFVF
jgi:hypothetical protein